MSRRSLQILILALIVAWAFDFLFWRKTPGISFALYMGILLVAGFYLAASEGKSPARASLWLLIPIILFALFTTIRLEPMTVFVSVMLTLALLMILVYTFRSGRWTKYSLIDLCAIPFRLLWAAASRPMEVFRGPEPEGNPDEAGASKITWRSALPVLRGLLLAIPVVIVFAALLSSADPVFGGQIERFLNLFSFEKLFEYAFRGVYILILAYVLTGIYLYALNASQEEKLIGVETPLVKPILGVIEAGIVLISVNLLFIAFVVIQFQYFFGGSANINYEGFTYAEYARRGFGELVFVAFLGLLLYLVLSSVTRRETPLERRVFSGLGVLLGLLIGVILVSAFQRLLLYEDTFGFTRLRTYPHVFMVWLGILLLAFILLEIAGRQRAFGMALLAASLGFALTLGLLNVDGFIAGKNLERGSKGAELDLDYLLTLSVDSTPTLIHYFESPDLSPELHESVGAVLACQKAELDQESQSQTWTGFHFSRLRARRLLDSIDAALDTYPVDQRSGGNFVMLGGSEKSCQGVWWLD